MCWLVVSVVAVKKWVPPSRRHHNNTEVFNAPWAAAAWTCEAAPPVWSFLKLPCFSYISLSLSGYCTFEATSSANPASDWQLLPAWPPPFDWQENNGEAGGVCGRMLSWKSVRGDRETERGEGTREDREKRLDGCGKSTLSSFLCFHLCFCLFTVVNA